MACSSIIGLSMFGFVPVGLSFRCRFCTERRHRKLYYYTYWFWYKNYCYWARPILAASSWSDFITSYSCYWSALRWSPCKSMVQTKWDFKSGWYLFWGLHIRRWSWLCHSSKGLTNRSFSETKWWDRIMKKNLEIPDSSIGCYWSIDCWQKH